MILPLNKELAEFLKKICEQVVMSDYTTPTIDDKLKASKIIELLKEEWHAFNPTKNG